MEAAIRAKCNVDGQKYGGKKKKKTFSRSILVIYLFISRISTFQDVVFYYYGIAVKIVVIIGALRINFF